MEKFMIANPVTGECFETVDKNKAINCFMDEVEKCFVFVAMPNRYEGWRQMWDVKIYLAGDS